MKIIHSDDTKRVIKDKFSYDFKIPQDGLYLIEITASAENWRQNWKTLFQHDDLAVSINDINFPRKDGEIFHAPTGWNGNNLKGLLKTNAIIINLPIGKHQLNFLSRRAPTIENIKIIQIDSPQFVYLPTTNNPPVDGDRRQWITIASTGVAIKEIIISASCKKYQNSREDDDIKLIIDEKIVSNDAKNSHRDWFWCGKILQGNTKEFKRQLNFDATKHNIELYADRSPKIESMNFTTESTTSEIKGVIVWEETILRKEPDQNSEALIENIKQNTTISIIKKAIAGIRPTNSSGQTLNSDRWHKARFGNIIGYIYCEAIEIENESENKIKKIIMEKSKELDESGCLMFAIAKRESQLFPYATSKVGAQGLFQLMTAPLEDVNRIYKKNFTDRFNVDENIEAGILYFKNLKEKYKNSNNAIEKTLAAWNWGQNHIDKNSAYNYDAVPSETQIFIKDVLKTKTECER